MRQAIADLIGVTGLGLIGYGLYQFLPWVAYTVVGALLIIFACLASRQK